MFCSGKIFALLLVNVPNEDHLVAFFADVIHK